MPECVNMRTLFGARFRVGRDPAASARDTDPWLLTLPCRYGTIYPHGGDVLAVEVDGHSKLAARVAALPGVRAHQWGDQERTLLFPVALFDQVAAIVRPRRRRVLTEEQRQAARERLAAYQFSPAAQSGSEGQTAVRT